jgi:hypothetical protein
MNRRAPGRSQVANLLEVGGGIVGSGDPSGAVSDRDTDCRHKTERVGGHKLA